MSTTAGLIANARMYSVCSQAAAYWEGLLGAVIARAKVPVTPVAYPAPAPLDELWRRDDLGAVFMCGLPFSLADPAPVLVAAPVPSPPEFAEQPAYWSEFVVRIDSAAKSIPDTFGGRLALTIPGSQSGCVAALSHLQILCELQQPSCNTPPYHELIAPTITPIGALSAVVSGAADAAPIDAYALRLMQRFLPELAARVRVVGRTASTPIPPLVGSRNDTAVGKLRATLLQAPVGDDERHAMDQLLLRRFVRMDPSAYAVLRTAHAATAQYWRRHRLATVTHPKFAALFAPPVP